MYERRVDVIVGGSAISVFLRKGELSSVDDLNEFLKIIL